MKSIASYQGLATKKYLRIDFMGDYLFDYHMNMNITEEDLK